MAQITDTAATALYDYAASLGIDRAAADALCLRITRRSAISSCSHRDAEKVENHLLDHAATLEAATRSPRNTVTPRRTDETAAARRAGAWLGIDGEIWD